MSDFDRAFELIIGHEGGYVNNPRDPGGETKYGVSKRSYPKENIKKMTLERAKQIYKRDFWDPIHGDDLRWPLNFNVFDGAINSGVRSSVEWLQRALGVADDGKLGPITLGAAVKAEPVVTSARYMGHRLQLMTKLSIWPDFGKGWARRVAKNLVDL